MNPSAVMTILVGTGKNVPMWINWALNV